MAKKNWIKSAIKHEGALTSKAEKAGKTVAQYTSDVLKPGSKANATTKRQANLAKTLKKINRKPKANP